MFHNQCEFVNLTQSKYIISIAYFLALLQKFFSIFESSEDFKCRHGILAMEHSQHCKVAIYLQEHNISIHIYLQEN